MCKKTILHRFIDVYNNDRKYLATVLGKKSVKSRNVQSFKLDIQLMKKEFQIASDLASQGMQKKVHFGKYGSKDACERVAGIHPLANDIWAASKACESWHASRTGWNAYATFCKYYYDSGPLIKPSIEVISHFIGYLFKIRGKLGVSASTVQNYVSHTRTRFADMGWSNEIWYDHRISMLIVGCKNLENVSDDVSENKRRVINFDLLRVFGDALAREPMKLLNYLNLWLSTLIYFWTSLRPSDLLPRSYAPHAIATAIRWGDVRCKSEDSFTLLVKSPKSSERKGGDDVVSLIRWRVKEYCPVYHLELLLDLHRQLDRSTLKHEFIFRKENLKPFLQKDLNTVLKRHLSSRFPGNLFSCYSLRAGMLNELAGEAAEFSNEELRAMGKVFFHRIIELSYHIFTKFRIFLPSSAIVLYKICK